MTVRPTVLANPSLKRSFAKTLFKQEEFENADFSFSSGQKTVWKRNLFENDVTFPQTQIQFDQWLLCFEFLRRSVEEKHLMCF